MEVELNRAIIQAFISYNRSYDEIKKGFPQIDREQNFSDLGDTLEILAFEELIKAYPEAAANKDMATEIMFDIIDADALKSVSASQLAVEFLNYFVGELESRTAEQ